MIATSSSLIYAKILKNIKSRKINQKGQKNKKILKKNNPSKGKNHFGGTLDKYHDENLEIGVMCSSHLSILS